MVSKPRELAALLDRVAATAGGDGPSAGSDVGSRNRRGRGPVEVVRRSGALASSPVSDVSVPTDLGTVLDPAWLSRALDDIDEGSRIVAVEEVGSSETLAQKVRFRVTVESADGARRTTAYCVKAHLDGSSGADLLNEARFYRDLAPRLDVRMPRVYYTGIDDDADQAMIVMEDIVANGGRFLSAHSPYSLDTTRDTLGQLARLHAGTWGDEQLASLEWLAPRAAAIAQYVPNDVLQTLLDDGRSDGIAPALRDARNVSEAMLRTAAHDATCVIHGDTQSGNAYLDPRERACWLDWQVVQLGNWATDVSYHIATVLDIEDRREHEAALLRHYLTELASFDVPVPPWDEGWDLYTRSFSYAYFLWAITRVSSREVVLIHIPRLAAALTDHDTFRRLGIV